MSDSVFQDMIRYIDFTEQDAQRLRELQPTIRPHLPAVADAFYERIVSHPSARQLITGGEKQLSRLHGTLATWLDELFSGIYDESYYRKRLHIGAAHVRIGMPQYLMFAAMERVWQELESYIREKISDNAQGYLASTHKLVSLETAIMLESYKESYSQRIREVEQEALRERLSQAEHLAQIGHLAANLAHEIKNPLAGISGAIQVMRETLEDEHPHHPILGEILRQIDRLDTTVKDLLVYARPKPPRFKHVNLTRTVERVLTVLSGEQAVGADRIEVNSPETAALFADEAQLEQLLMNLTINAAQASPQDAPVRLSVESEEGAGVKVTVADEGCGMDDEALQHAFDPFFTTKTKGTGLGLPICRKIVEAHGGTISIHSRREAGTTVTVRLPHFPPASSGGQEADEYTRISR
jgi:signal transduction histidine kinase